MNTACYTTEYRQCLSPKGQLYLKADSEGKPDLTFNYYFRRSLVTSRHIYIYIYILHILHILIFIESLHGCFIYNKIRLRFRDRLQLIFGVLKLLIKDRKDATIIIFELVRSLIDEPWFAGLVRSLYTVLIGFHSRVRHFRFHHLVTKRDVNVYKYPVYL